MECRDNQTMTAVTKVMRHQLQPYLFQDRDVVRAHVHSFGCQLNVSDGERIRGMLIELGYTMTDSYEDADLILFNTCAVRESAEDRVYGILGKVQKGKPESDSGALRLYGIGRTYSRICPDTLSLCGYCFRYCFSQPFSTVASGTFSGKKVCL